MPWPLYPFIINVPYGSSYIPGEERGALLLSDRELASELNLVTDHCLGDLAEAGQPLGVVHRFRYSRLVVDPERPRDGRGEASPVPTRTLTGQLLRRLDDQEQERLLTRYYDPHQASFEAALDFQVKNFGWCLIVDLRTFADSAGPDHPGQDPLPVGVVVKTEPLRTPETLASLVEAHWRDHNFSVAREKLPGSARLPGRWTSPATPVQSITMALSRGLYLASDTGQKGPEFQGLKAALGKMFDLLFREYRPDRG